ncbi:MAG TPA: hypothetical protein VMV44_01380 [Rectinemataceae bacterium]|nr:hypothetical protein [Rectinemataceae bacterium]
MTEEKEKEFEKRVDDIRAIRTMLADREDVPLIYPWAFFIWAFLVAGGSISHYLAYTSSGLDVHKALVWIWLPILIVGAVVESVSFALKAGRSAVPLLNRRFGGALLGGLASVIILTLVMIRLAMALAMTPGLVLLVGSFAMIFYAQISYSSLFIEAFVGIAVGLLLEFGGFKGPVAFLASGVIASLLYCASGIHIVAIERRRRG